VAAELIHVDGRTDITKLTVAFRNSANAPKTCYQPQEHKQSAVTFSDLGMIVKNPGNMAQPTNLRAFGSHFNHLENHPMCADSALDINTFQFAQLLLETFFVLTNICNTREASKKTRVKTNGTVLSAPLGRSNCTLKWRTNQFVIRNTLGLHSNYSTVLSSLPPPFRPFILTLSTSTCNTQ
jgi:hypothetical protein